MKKIMLSLLMMSLLGLLPGLVQAETEIYWGTVPSPEPVITDADFSNKYEGQKDYSVFREKEIYDVWKPGLFDEEEEAGVVISQPVAEPFQAAPVISRQAPAGTTDVRQPARSVESARPTTTPSSPARVSPAAPKPAETTPGTQEAASAAEPEKPGTKKMKWGQSDNSSSSEPKTKFEWGQNKPGAQ